MQSLLTVTELAQFLGISPQTIYNRRSYGTPHALPTCVQIGAIARYRLSDVEAWLDQLSHESRNETYESKSAELPKRRGRPTKAEEIQRRKKIDVGRPH
ncbi:hypothetical protein B9Z47_05595 [Limnohabitans sp. 2KL-1]|uniref:helix-turn-helix transcriptional regulator n=1 Tax=Limnohabitans sp. 2KL-1 TaxID=1100699 RepID=UPI000D360621|nr:helix-turn-helix domain-containing protein [Limnohabitans sp. 2KL-1]PUE48989.1 hypothetical protein B9Z47_05595 [Limnohabitans sp. 2KL-1]